MPPYSGVWSLFSTDLNNLSTKSPISWFEPWRFCSSCASSWYVFYSRLSMWRIVLGFWLCKSMMSWCWRKRVVSSRRPYRLNRVSRKRVEYDFYVCKCKLSMFDFAFSVTAFIYDLAFWVSFNSPLIAPMSKLGLPWILMKSLSSCRSLDILGHCFVIWSFICACPVFN